METPHVAYTENPLAAAPVAHGARLRGAALASVLASLMLTLFLSALDQTIVNTALPRILSDINGYDRYTWPIIAYLLTSTTMIPIIGKFSDQFGRKWFLIVGVVIFLAGSALCGAAKEAATLVGGDPMNFFILFRGVQGIGGGILLGLVFTIVGDIFTPAERARWQGLFTAVFGLASVVGPTAGGFITDTYGWPWIFYVNLPLGVVALFLLVRFLPANISVRTTQFRGWAGIRRIDFLGALTAAAATVCLVLGLTWGGGKPPNGYPWDSPEVIGILSAAGALLVIFLLIERFVAREPILPLDLFKNRVFTVGALLSLTVGMAMFGIILYLPLFIQDVLKQSATDSGTAVTPLTLTMAATAAIGGLLVARIGRYQWLAILGGLTMSAGLFLMTQLTAASDIWEVVRDMLVVGMGMGMTFPVLTLAVQNAIPRTRLGAGTGAVTYIRSMGQLFGVAGVGAVATNGFNTALAERLPSGIQQLPQATRDKITDYATLQRVLGRPDLQHQAIASATQQADANVVPGLVQNAVDQQLQLAIQQAAARVPPGPTHDAQVAALTQRLTEQLTPTLKAQITPVITNQVNVQVTDTFNQLFEAARLSLAVAVQHAFFVSLIVCGVIVVLALLLKDVPLSGRVAPAEAVRASEARVAAATGGIPVGAAALASGPLAPAVNRLAGLAATPALSTPPRALPDLTRAALGSALAMLAREARSPNADPTLLAALSTSANGQYPHEWSAEERGRAVVRDMIEPMASALLASSLNERAPATNGIGFDQGGDQGGGRRANGYRNGAIASSARPATPYTAESRPMKRVRVTRRLMRGDMVVGEQAIETAIPLDGDTEAAAADLRARLDSAPPDDAPTFIQVPHGGGPRDTLDAASWPR